MKLDLKIAAALEGGHNKGTSSKARSPKGGSAWSKRKEAFNKKDLLSEKDIDDILIPSPTPSYKAKRRDSTGISPVDMKSLIDYAKDKNGLPNYMRPVPKSKANMMGKKPNVQKHKPPVPKNYMKKSAQNNENDKVRRDSRLKNNYDQIASNITSITNSMPGSNASKESSHRYLKYDNEDPANSDADRNRNRNENNNKNRNLNVNVNHNYPDNTQIDTDIETPRSVREMSHSMSRVANQDQGQDDAPDSPKFFPEHDLKALYSSHKPEPFSGSPRSISPFKSNNYMNDGLDDYYLILISNHYHPIHHSCNCYF